MEAEEQRNALVGRLVGQLAELCDVYEEDIRAAFDETEVVETLEELAEHWWGQHEPEAVDSEVSEDNALWLERRPQLPKAS